MLVKLYEHHTPFGIRVLMDYNLYVGPITCYYHNCGCLQYDANTSALCPSDVELSCGMVDELVLEAVGEILSQRPDVKSIALLTACVTSFAGIDFDAIETQVEETYGVLCLQHENSRLLMPTPANFGKDAPLLPSDFPELARAGGKDGTLRMAAKIPQDKSVEGRGLLVLTGPGPFSPSNEIYQAASQWGFDWVQALSDWHSLEALRYARSTAFTIVANERHLPLAQALQERFGVEYVLMEDSLSVEKVDGYYEHLGRLFGKTVDISAARERALESRELARSACGDKAIELLGPADAVATLSALGVDAHQVQPGDFFRKQRKPCPNEAQERQQQQLPPRPDSQRHPNYPTYGEKGGAGVRLGFGWTKPEYPQPKLKPPRCGLWGYNGITDFMTRLAKEVG